MLEITGKCHLPNLQYPHEKDNFWPAWALSGADKGEWLDLRNNRCGCSPSYRVRSNTVSVVASMLFFTACAGLCGGQWPGHCCTCLLVCGRISTTVR